MFAELYATALSKWPAELRLPVRNDVAYMVEGLTGLESEISRAWWVDHPDEVLMVNLNWAIATAYHAAFRERASVRHEDLNVSVVRDKFEADLKRIEDGKVPTWTDDDRLIVARYFAANDSHLSRR